MLRPAGLDGRAPRQGTMLVWLLASLSVVIAVVAIGLDGGRLMDERRRARAAADAAALAAAADLYDNYLTNQGLDPAGSAKQAALDVAAANGYTNDGATSTITVNVPPTTGAFAGQTDHVEVVLQTRLKGSFSAAINGGDMPLQVRAVARGRPKKIGVLLLRSSGAGAFNADGNANLQVVNAPIVVNSNDGAAFTQVGGTVQAPTLTVGGGVQRRGGSFVGTVQTGAPQTQDPLRSLPAPNPGDYVVRSTQPLVLSTPQSGTVLQPGIYRGGLHVTGQAAVTLMPGVYIMQGGGLQLSGQSNLSGTGVVIYNTSGTFSTAWIYVTGNSKLNLTASTTGAYAGICLFQDRSVGLDIEVDGNANLQIAGLVYAPTARVELESNGPTSNVGGILANNFHLTGSGTVVVDGGSNRPRVPEVLLVE